MRKLRVVTVAVDAEREARVAAELAACPETELLFRCVDRVELVAAIRGAAVDAIFSVGLPTWLDRQAMEEAGRHATKVVIATRTPGVERWRPLGASVVDENAPISDFIHACSATIPPPVTNESETRGETRGRVTAVWGAKGSPGRTFVAMELAGELAQSDAETLLVDADMYGSDVMQLLGIVEELPTIVWAAQMAAKDELDRTSLARDLRRVGKAGPVLLPGVPRPDLWADISDFAWRELLGAARRCFRYTVCDVGFCIEPPASVYAGLGEDRNRLARAVIAEADHVVAVCRGDPVGIKNFLWAFEQLRELRDEDTIYIVGNRVERGDERDVTQLIKRHTGKRPLVYLPDRSHDVARAISRGTFLRDAAPGSDISAAIRSLAEAVGGRVEPRGVLQKFAFRG